VFPFFFDIYKIIDIAGKDMNLSVAGKDYATVILPVWNLHTRVWNWHTPVCNRHNSGMPLA
jgi:hypothetical protein